MIQTPWGGRAIPVCVGILTCLMSITGWIRRHCKPSCGWVCPPARTKQGNSNTILLQMNSRGTYGVCLTRDNSLNSYAVLLSDFFGYRRQRRPSVILRDSSV
ncbi:hypothetical protein F5X99DRAFT_368209 [Biscogniauxia marginata]|nr:hypothetical protein F5X99DRAFT_368209 [Biscogniauxia marginata]